MMNRSVQSFWRSYRSVLLAIVASLALLPIPSLADDELEALLMLPLDQLKAVPITGSTLTDQTLRQVPASVSVFTRGDIRRLGVDSLDELMNFVPGFQSARQGEAGNHSGYSSRGRKIGTAGVEILVLIDGLRIDNVLNTGSAFTLPMASLGNIERVEFIRGPGSAIYGSNAFLGVINIITVRDVNEINVAVGDNAYRNVEMLGSTAINDLKLAAFARYFADNGEDFSVINTGQRTADHIDTSDPRSGAELQVTADYRDTSLQVLHARRDTNDFYVFDTVSNGINEMDSSFTAVALEQRAEWNPRFESRVRVGMRGWSEDSVARFPFPVPPGYALPRLYIDVEDEEKWIELHNDLRSEHQGSLQFGVEYRHPEIDSAVIGSNYNWARILGQVPGMAPQPLNTAGDLYLVPPVERDILGAYLQHQRQLWAATELTLGLRYDDYSSVGDSVSPRIAITHAINAVHTIKLLYGEAFRAPSFNELYSDNNPVLRGNDHLDPETVQTWEAIWLMQWQRHQLSLAYFDNTFQDSIVETTDIGLRSLVNADEEKSNGIEVEASTQIASAWYARATYTYFDAKPDSAFRESDALVSLLLNYQARHWNANIGAYYQDEKEMVQHSTERVTLDDFWNTYAKVSYTFGEALHWSTYLQVKNLLDEDFSTPAQGRYLSEGITNRGREVRVGLGYRF